jgi:hypothetical protein
VWAVFLGFIGACFISGTARAQADVDHYKCYQVKQSSKVCQLDLATKCKLDSDCGPTGGEICLQKFPKGVNVSLTDQFGTLNVEVKKPKNLCPPTQKVPEGPQILNPNLHYKEYQIKGGGKLETRVLATDQFGAHVIELGGPKFLLVPTAKGDDAPVAAPLPGDAHYLCRQAKHKKKICTGDLTTKCKSEGDCAAAGGSCDLGLDSFQQSLVNQFGQESVEVKKIKFFCTPAQKGTEPAPDLDGTHLVGYQITGPDLAVGVHTNNQFGPEFVTTKKPKSLYVPAVKSFGGGFPPILVGNHKCVLDPSASSIRVITQALPLAPVAATGAIDINCGTTASSGKASCDCELQQIDPFELAGIGFICLTPGEPCPSGEIDCDGGNALDVTMDSDHNIGQCDGNPDCEAQCTDHCAAQDDAIFNSGCEGFCIGGQRDELACTDDSDCPGGSCPGKDGLPHGNLCGCDCINVGGAASGPGGLQCNVSTNIDVELGSPCGDGDVLIAVGTRCVAMTSQTVTAQLHNTNDTRGKDWPLPAYTATGSVIPCETLATSTTTDLLLVGVVNFFDSTIGDIQSQLTFACQ